MLRTWVQRTSGTGAALLVAGLLAGCGEPAPAPDDLCALVGDQLIVQMVPSPVHEAPYRTQLTGRNSISCAVSSKVDAPPRGELQVHLARYGPCTSSGSCGTREQLAQVDYKSDCEQRRINPETYGRHVEVTGLGQRACASVRESDDGAATVRLTVQGGADLVSIQYTARPSTAEKVEMAAQAVAGNVLGRL